MKSITSTIMAGVLLTAAGFANAEPVALSDVQMDQVSAGATALAGATAVSLGDLISSVQSLTNTAAQAPGFASATAISASISASLLYAAGSQSQAVAFASLP
jgi:hypothetical protein